MAQREKWAEDQREWARFLLDKAEEIDRRENHMDTAVRDYVSRQQLGLVEAACIIAADADCMDGLIGIADIYPLAAWNAAAYLAPFFNLRFMRKALREELPPMKNWANNWAPWPRLEKFREMHGIAGKPNGERKPNGR